MDLKPEQVRSALRQLRRHSGVEYRVGKPAPDALTTSTIWMNLPTASHMTVTDICPKLQDAPWFTGLRAGDGQGRIGVTVWGPTPVHKDIRSKRALVLGTEIRQPRMLVLVYGYGPSFGLSACEDDSYAQHEIRRVWPTQDVKLTDCQHITQSGLQRPTFSLTLEGVPAEWEQSIRRENDARLRQKVWVTCVTQQTTGARKHVNLGTQVVRGPQTTEESPSQ